VERVKKAVSADSERRYRKGLQNRNRSREMGAARNENKVHAEIMRSCDLGHYLAYLQSIGLRSSTTQKTRRGRRKGLCRGVARVVPTCL
jgi:hypothetical protein